MLRKAPLGKIVAGSVAPMVTYYLFRKADMALPGAVCASVWCLLVMAFWLMKERNWDAFSTFGGIYAVAELITVLLTHDPDWFLFAPIVFGGAFGFCFLLSIVIRRPLLRYFAEQAVGVETFPEHIRASRHYMVVWNRVTLLWAGVYLLKAVVLAALLAWTTTGLFLSARATLGWPVTAGLLAFSFWYPRYYWGHEPELVRVHAEPNE